MGRRSRSGDAAAAYVIGPLAVLGAVFWLTWASADTAIVLVVGCTLGVCFVVLRWWQQKESGATPDPTRYVAAGSAFAIFALTALVGGSAGAGSRTQEAREAERIAAEQLAAARSAAAEIHRRQAAEVEEAGLAAARFAAERAVESNGTPSQRVARALEILRAADGSAANAMAMLNRIPQSERGSAVIRAAFAEVRERQRLDRIQAAHDEAERHANSSLHCCDGTPSPSCICRGPHRGCCSHHGGVCGCEE